LPTSPIPYGKGKKVADRKHFPHYILPTQVEVLQQHMVLTVNVVMMDDKERPEVMLPDR
jgi:hypothetical protein